MAQTLEALLDSLTAEGALYERLPDNAVHCYACGHNCLIKEGRRGICKVRYNDSGALRVPWGYVGALQCDPTEKKPFFHVYPGSDTLTFGMLGCDLHCPYCLPPDSWIATADGPIQIGALFDEGEPWQKNGAEEVRRPTRDLLIYTHTGQSRRARKLFRHPYHGQMVRVRAWYLPPLECTPEHGLFVAESSGDGLTAPRFVPARHLTPRHRLAIPKRFSLSQPVTIDTAALLQPLVRPIRAQHTIGRETLQEILQLSAEGVSSREIGRRIGKGASHVRHLRSKVNRGCWDLERLEEVGSPLVIESDSVRLPKEHRPGIPLALALDTRLARLLGYYCAEGCVVRDKTRVHTATLNFSFGLHEDSLADEVAGLLQAVFGVRARKILRETTIGVAVDKSSVALCLRALCGHGARDKRVPSALYTASPDVVEAFLRAYAEGDGSTRGNGLTQILTVSEELAYGVAWLALKLGLLPALTRSTLGDRPILGRRVAASPYQYTVSWYFEDHRRKFADQDDDYWYVRIRSIDRFDYDGDVYNLEVAEEHSYIANLITTHNCQNWVTSQALRDPASESSGAYPQTVTPKQLVDYGRRAGAKLVGSSYNEPLITSEWAVAVFKEAARAGLKCVYISNGNATRQVLEYIRPHTVAYKIDLKCMSDKNYRKLGAVLQNVLDGIKLVHDMGFWLEIVTLTIPGFNDSAEELTDAARFLASISPDIPWHVTAFHKDYKMIEPDNTGAQTLIRAAEIGREAGLNFVYAGNLPGQVGEYENTYCPKCSTLLIARYGYVILDYRLTDEGSCPDCGEAIAGIWPKRGEVRIGTPLDIFHRVPRRVR